MRSAPENLRGSSPGCQPAGSGTGLVISDPVDAYTDVDRGVGAATPFMEMVTWSVGPAGSVWVRLSGRISRARMSAAGPYQLVVVPVSVPDHTGAAVAVPAVQVVQNE